MKKDKYPILELEKLFVSLNEEIYGEEEEWFGSNLSHSIFTPAMTLWLMMLQALHTKSLSGAIDLIRQGAADLLLARNVNSKKAKTKYISGGTGAYAQARKRLEKEAVKNFVQALNDKLCVSNKASTYIMDGSVLTLQKTDDIEREYPCHRNNHGTSLPQMRVVFATNAVSGTTPIPAFAPEKVSEQVLSYAVMASLPRGSQIIADANFGIFYVVSEAVRLGHVPFFRLTTARAKSLLKSSMLPAEGEFDVVWEPSAFEKGKHPQFNNVPAVRGRVIMTTLIGADSKPLTLAIFTTSTISRESVIAEYKKRHNIEVDIRQLKITLEADFISARTKDMVEKELLIRVAAHNLLRAIIREATHAVGLTPREVSFKGVVMYIKTFGDKIRTAKTDDERLDFWERFLIVVTQLRIYPRKKRRPTYPRKLRRNSRLFPLLRS